MESTKIAVPEQSKEERKASQVPAEVYDPEHPYKDWDPSAPFISDELEDKLVRGELVDLG